MNLSRRRTFALLGASALAACASDIDRDAGETLAITPRETQGPFFPEDVTGESDVDLTRLEGRDGRARGQVITVRGRVLDRFGAPIAGARVELWQANAAGRYAHSADAGNPAPLDPDFQGYGVITTGADGAFRFTTIRPGGYLVAQEGPRTPHLHWKIAAGAAALTTQSYFPGDPANETDFLIRAMGAPAQRLMARDAGVDEAGAPRFDWDVVLPA